MSIDLNTFASGDTDYIGKFNDNFSQIEAAINSLQNVQLASNNAVSIAQFLEALFNGATALIGTGSYLPTPSGSNLNVAAGGAFLQTLQGVVEGIPTTLSFSGQPNGTYYIIPDSTGTPTRQNSNTGDAVYSVTWSGSVFGTVTRLVPVMFDVNEMDAARISSVLSTTYTSLDARLEAIETLAQAADIAASAVVYRKVGITIDGGGIVPTTGIKGQIQIDFNGTIVGWSAIADAVGDCTVSVAVKRTSPVSAPPTAPPIPDPVADKISASAPITLSTAQSASEDAAGLTGWSTAVQQWDVVQFSLQSVATIKQVTLYIRIQQS